MKIFKVCRAKIIIIKIIKNSKKINNSLKIKEVIKIQSKIRIESKDSIIIKSSFLCLKNSLNLNKNNRVIHINFLWKIDIKDADVIVRASSNILHLVIIIIIENSNHTLKNRIFGKI